MAMHMHVANPTPIMMLISVRTNGGTWTRYSKPLSSSSSWIFALPYLYLLLVRLGVVYFAITIGIKVYIDFDFIIDTNRSIGCSHVENKCVWTCTAWSSIIIPASSLIPIHRICGAYERLNVRARPWTQTRRWHPRWRSHKHRHRWRRGNRRDGWMSWARCVYLKKYWRLPAARRRNPLIITSLWMSSFLNRWQWISMENPRHYTGAFCIPWFDHHRENKFAKNDRTTAAMDACEHDVW